MPRSRPASSPLSYHKHTGQYYVTRRGKRVYLGADEQPALEKYHRLALGLSTPADSQVDRSLTTKELANRFLATQRANWRDPETTLKSYQSWLGRFLEDLPQLLAADLTVEMFAAWKLSLRSRGYAAESINHFLSAVRAMYLFGADSGLVERVPRLKRVRNESCPKVGSKLKPLYTANELRKLLDGADLQMQGMILLGLNCGFGPKDIRDVTWGDVSEGRVTLPRSKTGVCQTYALWSEAEATLCEIKEVRRDLGERLVKRDRMRSDRGHIFVTRFWRPWNKDAVAEQFRRLCERAGVPCHGFYRLRHCASTAMSLVATPHVHRKFMRHSQLQTQVGYTHTPDAEVDSAIMRAREKLLQSATSSSEKSPVPAGLVSSRGKQPQARHSDVAPGTPRRLPA